MSSDARRKDALQMSRAAGRIHKRPMRRPRRRPSQPRDQKARNCIDGTVTKPAEHARTRQVSTAEKLRAYQLTQCRGPLRYECRHECGGHSRTLRGIKGFCHGARPDSHPIDDGVPPLRLYHLETLALIVKKYLRVGALIRRGDGRQPGQRRARPRASVSRRHCPTRHGCRPRLQRNLATSMLARPGALHQS